MFFQNLKVLLLLNAQGQRREALIIPSVCSFTPWLCFGPLQFALARTIPGHSSGESSLQALFSKSSTQESTLALAPSPVLSFHNLSASFALTHTSTHSYRLSLGLQCTPYIACYESILVGCKTPLTLFFRCFELKAAGRIVTVSAEPLMYHEAQGDLL